MAEFTLRFMLCNFFLCFIICGLAAARHLLKNSLTGRQRYHVWFGLLMLLTVPFWPVRAAWRPNFLTWFEDFGKAAADTTEAIVKQSSSGGAGAAGWMNDFATSVSRQAPSGLGMVLCILWIAGMLFMTGILMKAMLRFRAVRKSSLPLQNPDINRIYFDCLAEMKIKRHIPIRSTAFLKSPVIVGFWKPCVYLPIHLISDSSPKDIRYMLLHELQHYRHKDALVNDIMNIAGIVYWFNPFVWYALREMRNDREVACDTSVLQM
ncbi:MAG: M56 family metallopeptidase, partial [Lachnospiraceae bacterium]|nr:M56 family metallopeptidase [Lachnospiraceae bacterium]